MPCSHRGHLTAIAHTAPILLQLCAPCKSCCGNSKKDGKKRRRTKQNQSSFSSNHKTGVSSGLLETHTFLLSIKKSEMDGEKKKKQKKLIVKVIFMFSFSQFVFAVFVAVALLRPLFDRCCCFFSRSSFKIEKNLKEDL